MDMPRGPIDVPTLWSSLERAVPVLEALDPPEKEAAQALIRVALDVAYTDGLVQGMTEAVPEGSEEP